MSQEAADKYSNDTNDHSVIVTDTLFVKDVPGKCKKRVDLPITHTAVETCGKALFANIVAIGAIVALSGCVSDEAIEKAVLARVPKGTEESNKKALRAGMGLVK